MPSVEAFFDPEPRLELMKDMGIDRALMWPTLASEVEERLADDPDAACAVVHTLNEWMYEHWTYNYSDTIFATPIVSLAKIDAAIDELQHVAAHGARAFLLPRRRRCPRTVAGGRSRCPSSTRSGSS